MEAPSGFEPFEVWHLALTRRTRRGPNSGMRERGAGQPLRVVGPTWPEETPHSLTASASPHMLGHLMFGIKTFILRQLKRAWPSRATRTSAPCTPAALPKAWLTPGEDALVPPREIWIGPNDPISHYYRWIWEYLSYLTLLTDLRRDQAVLELGCGHGRTARGLLEYLRPPGRYVGLDVDRRRLEDAQTRIQARMPTFEFVWADVHNNDYNPHGQMDAARYRFPFPDACFDVVFAASLYTHLMPPETENYFREARRVLKPGGRCLFSFFILDHYRGWGSTASPLYEFNVPLPGYAGVAVRDIEHPDAVIAYSLVDISSYAQAAGLRIDRTLPGFWSNPPDRWVNEQDLIVLSTRD
jgi:SAM-dependent methyltransferase